jgi:hypothetical protein
MPQPEGNGLRQDFSPRLTNMALGYIPSLTQFVGRQVAPSVPVGAQDGSYNIFPRGEWLRVQGKKLANAEPAPLGGFKFSKGTYSVDEYGLAANWTARDLNNAAVGGISPAKLKQMKTEFVTFQAHLSLEIDIAAVVRTGANWTTTHAGVASGPTGTQFLRWDDAASNPISDVKDWKEEMRAATGFKPNKMMLPIPVKDALAEHPDIIDRIKYTGSNGSPAKVNLQTLAELFELDQIIVPEGVKNTANENATDAISDIWGKDVFLFFTPPAPSNEVPSALYRFSWTGAADSMGQSPQPFGGRLNSEGLFIRNYITEREAAEWVESRWYTVPKATGAGLGILATTAVS